MNIEELESLARKAAEDGNFVAKANCLMALQDACSPEVILRLCAIARAAERYWSGVEEMRALMTRGLSDVSEYERFDALRISNQAEEDAFRAALRAAMGKER
jgi:hypothetical protein